MNAFIKYLKNWGIPVVILLLLAFFGTDLIRIICSKMLWLYYNTIDHPKEFDVSTTGQIGDTFGGLTGPYIALIASYLTFIAFWVQYRANEQQKSDLSIERFENKFYELIGLHRDNVNEISIGKTTSGRKAFISMFHELKFTYLCVLNYYNNHYPYKDSDKINDAVLYNIAYIIFFFGTGANSSKMVIDLIGNQYANFFKCLEEESINGQQKAWREARQKKEPIAINDGITIFTLNIKYKPMNGHMSRLSHYIRHIFQIVRFVDESYPDANDYEAKYVYITTLRAQLSAYEQLIIYYNALSVLGQPWLDVKKDGSEFLLKKYCVLKSLPLTLADFYKEPSNVFGTEKCNQHGKELFEWTEIKNRIVNVKS